MKIYKAQAVGKHKVDNITIEIEDECPDLSSKEWRKKSEWFFLDQALRLENALYESLPGGTYDQLLGLMLKRKSTHLVVPHSVGG